MTARAEIVGDPVDHLRSASIMTFWIAEAGIDAAYGSHSVTRAAFPAYLAERRADPDWRGCNVAAPLKLDALLLADEVTDHAAAAGAANLLALRGGRLVAGNTDVGALLAVLGGLARDRHANGITILGEGGAARSALVALRLLGLAGATRLQSRDRAAATALSVEFGLDHAPVPFLAPVASTGLINATALGRADQPVLHLDLAAMPGDGWVVDLVAGAGDTALLAAARSRGLLAGDGLAVLLEQCAASFETLFGVAPPRAKDEELMRQLRS